MNALVTLASLNLLDSTVFSCMCLIYFCLFCTFVSGRHGMCVNERGLSIVGFACYGLTASRSSIVRFCKYTTEKLKNYSANGCVTFRLLRGPDIMSAIGAAHRVVGFRFVPVIGLVEVCSLACDRGRFGLVYRIMNSCVEVPRLLFVVVTVLC